MRLFIGIPVPMSIRNTLRDAASGMRAAGIGGRYVDPANYHVTVKFLGDCEDRVLLASVADAMRDASAGVRPFRLTLDGYGAFRGAGGHTGHVRISDPDRELTRLYELLDASSYGGFDFENVWTIGGDGYPYARLHDTAAPLPLSGDANGDGTVSSADALLALRCAMGLVTFSPLQIFRADCDGDGVVTAQDAVYAMRVSMGY